MSDSFDEFFDDEQELAAQAAQADAVGATGGAAEAEGDGMGPAVACVRPASVDVAEPRTEPAAEHEADPGREPADAAAGSRVRADASEEGTHDTAPVASGLAHKAPPFWMVLAIAGVSLVLGIVIGYLIGTSTAIAELESTAAQNAQGQSQDAADGSVSMPEGHPQVEVDDEGNAVIAEGADGAATTSDPLTLANNYFDMGMSAMNAASDDESRARAEELFTQAIAHYDEYLAGHDSPSAEVDRAICVFYAGDHAGAIADLEAFTKRDATFAPAWANLGMFYESHGDADKAIDAYEQAVAAAEKDDTYGVKDYARQRLDELKK